MLTIPISANASLPNNYSAWTTQVHRAHFQQHCFRACGIKKHKGFYDDVNFWATV